MKRSRQKEETRKHLLDVAYEKFAENGFLATKTLDIARAAGISHGALFVHFPTKEDLLIHVIDAFGLRMGTKLQQLAATKGTVAEVLSIHLETIKEYEPFYVHLVIEGPLLPLPIRSRVFMIQAGIAHFLQKAILERSQLTTPIHLILNTWLGLIYYYLSNRDLFSPGDFSPPQDSPLYPREPIVLRKSVIETHGKELLNHFTNIFKFKES